MYRSAIGCVVFFIVEPLLGRGQSPPASTGFDVILIKRNVSGANGASTPPLQHGKLRFTNVTVKDVLSLAYYPIDPRHMKGGPDWIGLSGERYDVEATTEERVNTEERYHQMLQMMLAERFQLRAHVEAPEEPVYFLVPDKKGLKLKPTDPKSCVPASPEVNFLPNGTSCGTSYGLTGTHFEGTGMTTTTLAVYLGLVAGRPVIDRTGHEGMIDVQLDFIPPNRVSAAVDAAPSIFAALPEQLGLRLQPGRGPVNVLIVDHVERPSAN